MLRKITLCFTVICVCLMFFAGGCGPQGDPGLKGTAVTKGSLQKADVKLQFVAGEKATYKMATETMIDYKFEQPSLKKLDEKRTGSRINMTYLQEIENVEENGDAVVKITIQEIAYHSETKNKVNFDFDSTREADLKKPFAKLIGQSYKIKISPEGSATVIDVAAAKKAVSRGYDSQVAKGLLSTDKLVALHSILALPDSGSSSVSTGQSWKRSEASHPGLRWASKTFAKTYTVTQVAKKDGKQLVRIEMDAVENFDLAEGQKTRGLGPFAKIFDPEESYTGQIVLKDGRVDNYNEKFVGSYVAAEMPSNASADMEPDALTMGFTRLISIEKQN